MDAEALIDALDALANRHAAAMRRRDIRPLRGVRGVPDGELARLAAAAWKEHDIDLDADHRALNTLFGVAFEDGLLAIALAAAALPDDPEGAYELGLEWLERTDDPLTADAIGALLLGPGLIASGREPHTLLDYAKNAREFVRRGVAAAMIAWLPEPVNGPAVAGLRERLATPQVRFVEDALDELLSLWATAFLRDESPAVRKTLRRTLRVWARCSPDGLVDWADTVRSGLPKILQQEVVVARRRQSRGDA